MSVKRNVNLHKQISSSLINDIVYQHFNQSDHSMSSMWGISSKKVYLRINNQNLATPLCRQKENYWIQKLGTPLPYGCNDTIDEVCIVSSPTCRSVNVNDMFNSTPRNKRNTSHFISLILYDVSLNDIQGPGGSLNWIT